MAAGKILVLGKKGMLGQQLMRIFGSAAIGWGREEADVRRMDKLKLRAESLKPRVIINCAAYNDVDGAESNEALAFELNAALPGELAKICKILNIPLLHFSTNYVYDGEKGEYAEADPPNPQSVYAKSKAAGERLALMGNPQTYIIRTSVLFGPKGQSRHSKKSFVQLMLEKAEKTDNIQAVSDEVNSLTYALDLAREALGFLGAGRPYGVYHLVNSGQASWYDFAGEIFSLSGRRVNLLAVKRSEFPRKAKVPRRAVLLNTKLPQLRSWQAALAEFLESESLNQRPFAK